MKKIKAIVTINLGLYMDIRPEIEITVPEGLENEQLVRYLHDTYKGLLEPKPICKACGGTSKDTKINREGLCNVCEKSERYKPYNE